MDAITKVWPEWKTESELGHGAFGRVYKVKREEFGTVSYAAVKVIQIPQDDSEIRELKNTGMDSLSIKAFFEGTVKNLVNEIQILTSLKTAGNIVSIEDYKIVRDEDGIRWTVFIRMELLESLTAYLNRVNTISEKEVAQLGVDLCSALECCEQNHIIHRDIKPDNIFRNQYGTFKLGDFGISKQLEMTRNVMSQKGTSMYMAPEVYRGEKNYNQTVDIYALGITLYKLLNKGRFPFLPDAPTPLKPSDMEESMMRRMSGENVPAPKGINPAMAQMVIKACAYNSAARYQHASEMKNDLVKWIMQGDAGQHVSQQPVRQTSETMNGTMHGTMGGSTSTNMFQQEKTWSAYSNQGFMFGDDKTIGAPKQEVPKQDAPKTAQEAPQTPPQDLDVRVTITVTAAQAKAGGRIPVVVDGVKREQLTFPANIKHNTTYKFSAAGRSRFVQDPMTGKKRYMAGTLYVTVLIQGGETATAAQSKERPKQEHKKSLFASVYLGARSEYIKICLLRLSSVIIYYACATDQLSSAEAPRFGLVIAAMFLLDFIPVSGLVRVGNYLGSLFVSAGWSVLMMKFFPGAFSSASEPTLESFLMGLGIMVVLFGGAGVYIKFVNKYLKKRFW